MFSAVPLSGSAVPLTRRGGVVPVLHANTGMKFLLFFPAITAVLTCGCAVSMLENRVISDFVEAIEEENEAALRRVSSSRFEETSLRSDDVFRDLEIVGLPQGDVTIEEVETPSENRRSATVVDSKGTKYRFELVRSEKEGRWVVDDVLVRQRKKWMKVRMNVAWPASRVMDLVFSVREFLDVWTASDRDEILRRASPALARSLEEVPDSWLKVIAQPVAERFDSALVRKPEAQLTDDSAVVRVPIRGGFLLVQAIPGEMHWLIDNIEIHQRSESAHPGSIRRQADAVAALGRFLTAWQSGVTEQLRDVSTEQFFEGTLRFGDLSLVAMPSADVAPDDFSIRTFAGRVTILVPTDRDIVRFDLVDPELEERRKTAGSDPRQMFVVDSVILYDRTRQNERTLASVFTAPARASLFLESLHRRDTVILKQLSTRRLNEAVWNQVTPKLVESFTLPLNHLQNLSLTDSRVQGRRTTLLYESADGSAVECRLDEENGRLLMDDIRYADAAGDQVSLQTQLSLQIPVLSFASAWRQQNIEHLRQVCSLEFNRLALKQLRTVPDLPLHLAERLDTTVRSIRVTDERATVEMGLPGSTTAQVHLVREQERWLISDVTIPESEEHVVHLRHELRSVVARNLLNTTPPSVTPITARRKGSQMPATASEDRRPIRQVSVIRQASAERPEERTGSVRSAGYQVFGPDSEHIASRLNAPQEPAASGVSESADASASAPTEVSPAFDSDVPRPPESAVGPSLQEVPDSPATRLAEVPPAEPPAPEPGLNLSARPVPID